MKKLITGLFLISSISMAQPIKLLTTKWEPYFGPKMKDGGPMTKIISDTLAKMDKKLTIKYVPWKRAIEKGPESDGVMGCYYSKDREERFIYSKIVMQPDIHLYAWDGSTASQKKFKTVADLDGFKFGKLSGFVLGDLDNNIKYRSKVKKVYQLIMMAKARRIDLFAEDPVRVKETLKNRFAGVPTRLVDLGTILTPDLAGAKENFAMYICWSKKKYQNNMNFIKAFDANLHK